jgi:hypothetical protein
MYFSGSKLYFEERAAIDHFIPHAFVSHDLIWNLILLKNYQFKENDNLPCSTNILINFLIYKISI